MYSRLVKTTSWLLITLIMLSLFVFPARSEAAGFSQPAAAAAPALAPAARAYAYRVGSQYDYTWLLDVTTHSSQQNQSGRTDRTALTRVSGTVALTPLGAKADGSMVVEAVIGSLRFFSTGETGELVEATEVPTETLRLAQLPFYFAQLPSGRVTTVLFNSEETDETANFKRGIVSLFQMQLAGATETRSETDSSGIYAAQYRTSEEDATITITKERTEQSYQAFADPSIMALGADAAFATPGTPALAVSGRMVASFDKNEGVLRAVSTTDQIAARPAAGTPTYSGEGTATSSSASSQGTLTLQAVRLRQGKLFPAFPASATTDTVIAAIQAVRRVTVGVAPGVNVVVAPPTNDEALPLEDALAGLRGRPEDAAAVIALRQTLESNAERVSELDAALRGGSVETALYPGIIGALSGLRSPRAQAILARRFIANPAIDAAMRDRALTAVVVVPAPSSDLVQTVFDHSASGELSDQATLVLGALAARVVSSRPQESAGIIATLQTRLATARTPADTELALNALGNAGALVKAGVLTPYLSSGEPAVRYAAIDALRGHPYATIKPYIEQLLASPDPMVRDSAFAIQEAAGVASPPASESATAQPGEYHWGWQKFIGGGDVNAELLAKLDFKPNDPTSKGYLSAEAHVKANAWSYSFSLARAKVVSYMTAPYLRYYRTYFYLLGNKLVDTYGSLECSSAHAGNLYDNTLTFFNVSYTFWVVFLPVTLHVKATGTVSVPWTVTSASCLDYLPASGSADVTPQVYATIEGGASASVFILRGGIGATVDLFKTALPIKAMILGSLTPGGSLRVYASAKLTLQPLYARIYLWYQWRKFSFWSGFSWGHKHESTIWEYSLPSQQWILLNYYN